MTESNKLFAEFLGYKYYPHPLPNCGWRKENANPSNKISVMKGDYLCRNHKQLRFDTDWNWLMRVIEKIESLDINEFALQLQREDVKPIEGEFYLSMFGKEAQFLASVYYWQHDNPIEGLEIQDGNTKIEAVYKACLTFINWYNDNRNKI